MAVNVAVWLQLQAMGLLALASGLMVALPTCLVMLWEALTRPDFFTAEYTPAPASLLNGEHGEHIYIMANGIKFHAVTRGEGPLLLCLHGFPECWYSYKHVLAAFSASHKVVAVDLRGYGETAKPSPTWWGSAAYDFEHLLGDVAALIPALGYESCDLVSHDWGGTIAWQFTMRHPDMVRRLVALSMPHPKAFVKNMGLAQAQASWYIFLFQLPWLPELLVTRRNHYMTRRGVFTGKVMGCQREGAFTSEDLAVYLHNSSTPGVTGAGINYYRNLFTRDLVYEAQHPAPKTPLPVPVLSVIPDKDGAILTSTYAGQAKYVADLTELRLTNSSHWVLMDAPREVIAAMYDFLQVPPAARMALEEAAPVQAEPCTSSRFLGGVLAEGSTGTPVPEAALAGSETRRRSTRGR